MSTPEAKVKAQVVKTLKKYGAYYFFPATHGYGRSGVPDVVCCYKGKFLAFECKAGKNKCTPLQLKEIDAIGMAGGEAYVIKEDNVDLVRAVLEDV
jgi:Holliday junction resolvase